MPSNNLRQKVIFEVAMTVKTAQIPDVSQYEVQGLPDVSQYEVSPSRVPGLDASPQSSAFKSVKEMQMAILTFANVLSSHPVMSMQDTGTQERQRARGEKDTLGGTRAFGRFLVDQYINNENVVGNQFVNVGLEEPLRSDTAISNRDLKGIIDTIRRIGSPGTSEHKADGIWQTRTNNALKQIYAVGAGLLHFAKDAHIQITGFTDDKLKEFGLSIPAAYTDLKKDEIDSRAQELTKYIDALGVLYTKFEDAVLDRPAFKEIINQDKPIVDHSKNHQEELSAEDKGLLEANRDAAIPGVNINGKPVRLADIESTTAFTTFLKSANVDMSKPDATNKQIANLKSMVENSGSELGAGF